MVVLDEYVIPEEIDGIPITRLGERAFLTSSSKKSPTSQVGDELNNKIGDD